MGRRAGSRTVAGRLSTNRAAADHATQKQEDPMKHVLFRVPLLVAVLICLAALAFAQAPLKPDWKERFQAHDKNGDGKIDRAEFQEWMVDSFFQRDANHKGYLVFEDLKDVMSAETFKTYDKRGDGKLRLPDFLNAVFLDFEAIDVNKDGQLTMEEIEIYLKRTGK